MLQPRAEVEPNGFESGLRGIPFGWIPFALPAAKTAIALGSVCCSTLRLSAARVVLLVRSARLGPRLVRAASWPDPWGDSARRSRARRRGFRTPASSRFRVIA
jgi:hypothetical protein